MTIRFAQKEDSALILRFIKELAAYENMANEVEAMDDWTVYRIAGDRLTELAEKGGK